jgi:hypothetical protein
METAALDLAYARGVRLDRAAPVQPVVTERAGCKGPACPLFATCRGRCASWRPEGRLGQDDALVEKSNN